MLRYYLVQTINQREDQMAQLRSAIVLIAGVLVSNAAVARDLAPLVDQNVPVVTGSGKPASPEAVGVAISNAAASGKRVWVVKRSAPDRVLATYNVRQHAIAVDIAYSANAYSIHYVGSENMRASEVNGVKVIHPFYNNWVDELKRGINAELGKL